MLGDGDQDLVALFEVGKAPGPGDQVDAFGGVAGENDFLRAVGVQEGADLFPRPLVAGGGLLGQVVKAPQGVGVIALVVFLLRLNHTFGPLAGGRAVQKGDVRVGEQGKIRPEGMAHGASSSSAK